MAATVLLLYPNHTLPAASVYSAVTADLGKAGFSYLSHRLFSTVQILPPRMAIQARPAWSLVIAAITAAGSSMLSGDRNFSILPPLIRKSSPTLPIQVSPSGSR